MCTYNMQISSLLLATISLMVLMISLVVCTNMPSGGDMTNVDSDDIQYFVPYRRANINNNNLKTSASDVLQSQSISSSPPVYASPFARSDSSPNEKNYWGQESSGIPTPIYAPQKRGGRDLKVAASYGHGHHGYGHHGYDHSGWLDMGAYTGGKGSFGWFSNYPVGKHGYGRK